MDRRARRTLVTGMAVAAFAVIGCGNDETERAVQAPSVGIEEAEAATPKNSSHGSSDAAQIAMDKTLYFGTPDSAQP